METRLKFGITDKYKPSEGLNCLMVDLATFNMILDIILKPVAIAVLIGLALLLRDLDRVVRSIERSAESVETTARTLDEVVSVARKIPFVGRKRRRDVDVE